MEQAQPNYRIYERTGGGETTDIYADSLDSAIQEAKDWMLEGEWGDEQGKLRFEVAPIVRVKLNAEGFYQRPADDCSYTPDEDGDLVDEDGDGLGLRVGDIDEESTDSISSRTKGYVELIAKEPKCEVSEDGEHDWQQPWRVVGGLKENPGVWGSGHGAISSKHCCAKCGVYCRTDYGATDSSDGTQCTKVAYGPADENSEEWVESLQQEEVEETL